MSRPVWDGDGEDPWLPHRLESILDVETAERSIYEAVWAALSAWLTATARRVLGGGIGPNPDVIFSRAPAWERDVADLIVRVIIPVMDRSYRDLFGGDFSWRERPNVINYLTGVSNRLTGIPNEVFDLVGGQIAAGVTLGEDIPAISRRVEGVLDVTDSERWPNRAVVIARTETLGALNGSRADAFAAFAEEEDVEMERMWLSTIDTRTRPTHVLADQQRVGMTEPFMVGGFALMFPGDPSGPAQEVIQCVPAETMVEFPSVRAVMRRWFDGEMVLVGFAGGDQLTITPNHPVLRSDGEWTPAGLLTEGDHCVRSSFGGEYAGHPYENGGPTEIGKLHRAASELQRANRVTLSPPDLHGDAPHGEIEVIPVDGNLRFDHEPASDQQVEQFGLSLADAARSSMGGADRGTLATRVARGEADGLRAPFGVRAGRERAPVGGVGARHAKDVSLTGSAGDKPEIAHTAADHVSAYAESAGHDQDALPPLVSLAKVVKIDRFDFRGHVFNLDTGSGWYSANGITVKNCRCTTLLLEKGEHVDLSHRQLKRS